MQLAKVANQFQAAGATLWAVSPQTTALNEALAGRYSLPFPILADSDQAVIRAWGPFNDRDPKQRLIPYPATYVIDRQGTVRWCQLSFSTRDRPVPGQILAAVGALADV